MKVEVTAEFYWAPDGNNVRLVKVGEVLEGRGAEVAMLQSKGKPVEEDERPLYRLPLEPEYRKAGYTGDYATFLQQETDRATLGGFRVEVRDLTPAEEAERARRLDEDAGTKPPAELTEADVQTLVDREPAARGQFAPDAAAQPADVPAIEAAPPVAEEAPVESPALPATPPPAPSAPAPNSTKKKKR